MFRHSKLVPYSLSSLLFLFSIIELTVLISICIAVTHVDAGSLQNLVDVKGNDAIREIRILYDIEEPSDLSPTQGQNRHNRYDKPEEMYSSLLRTNSHNYSNFLNRHRLQQQHQQYDKYVRQNVIPQQQQQKQQQQMRHFPLQRGRPMHAEIDFVPRYIPAGTMYVAVSVELPAHIRGRKWILGWHREQFTIPECRLCTNRAQSYTLPVTLFLPDDGWCPEGRVPTIWKIESLPSSVSVRPNNSPFTMWSRSPSTDQTDNIIAYAYDEYRQILIRNDANSTVNCRGISEAIMA